MKRVFFLGCGASFLLIGALLAGGCQYKPGTPASRERGGLLAQAKDSQSFLQVNSVALLPIEIDRSVGDVVNDDQDFMNLLRDTASEATEFELTQEKSVEAAAREARASSKGIDAAEIARKVGADAALSTNLTRYQERKGSRLGANAPAQVGFVMSLVDARDGSTLWRGTFHFTDKALSEDLLRLGQNTKEQGAGWESARALLRSGFSEALRDIAARRRSAFLSR